MTRLIVVCGLPGTGKTTLARALAQRWRLPCFQKDATYKEPLYELLGGATLADSRRCGAIAMQLLFRGVEEQLRLGVSCILEAPLGYAEDMALLASWERVYHLEMVCMVCTVDEDERMRRFRGRVRHAAHHDGERSPERGSLAQYDALPGRTIIIDTQVPVEDILIQIERKIEYQLAVT
ncbi:AAA family ATPase [Candidatus Uhrbacteria bacterium]|nr:AAA family ATPase [Candidatus Uhrbacteria bacterium]